MESRKQAVSIRMSTADLRNVKKLAKRLGVRDSDVIRFAVKSTLARLGPLFDSDVRGRNLVPVFVESGTDIFRYLELDAVRLEGIINDGVDDDEQVDHQDVQLIAMSGFQQPYARLRLSSMNSSRNGNPSNGNPSNGNHEAAPDTEKLASSLRSYLYQKYGYEVQHNNGSSITERGNKL